MAEQRIATCLAPDIDMPPVDVVIQRLRGETIPELGLTGFTPRRSCMAITLDPDNPHFEASLKAGDFIRILTHEFHHCLRFRSVGYGTTLAEALVSEGLADHFDREVNGGDGQLWDHALGPGQWPALLRQAEEAFGRSDYDHHLWFFGGHGCDSIGLIPRWAGYTIGYHLVGAYLDMNPEARPSRMAETPAMDIVTRAWAHLREESGEPTPPAQDRKKRP
ncbi:DUF2268 domain-containing putative Zn-dependent protease [Microvirga sp. G4-2]|uniref:DUF2268 domain-containing putative Zn-dependent protease n=1 Tax=Microvirga sp. G4-2 TaxID=3434467 RepID=UPI004044D277